MGEKTKELEKVLEECREIFEEPRELPPNRRVDHKIPLKSGIEAINIQPYRYPHVMKSKIERQVVEMLKARII